MNAGRALGDLPENTTLLWIDLRESHAEAA
jgi:hypothetical protein